MLHTPSPVAAASGTVTTSPTSNWVACSERWRAYSIRLKKIHIGACRAKVSGR